MGSEFSRALQSPQPTPGGYLFTSIVLFGYCSLHCSFLV